MNIKPKRAIIYLKSSEGKILSYLNKVVASKDFSYRTFGTAIEEHLTDAIVKVLAEGGFIKNKKDYFVSPHKNYFPDFELKTKPSLAIEFKTGNLYQFRKNKWVVVKNSENDMGTLNEWLGKIDKFGGENIYYIFVTYSFNSTKDKKVISVEIAPFYYFLGINKGKVLKYREKDGNLRPKNFGIIPPVKNLEQFKDLLVKTIIYRSKRIIKKHKSIILKFSNNSV